MKHAPSLAPLAQPDASPLWIAVAENPPQQTGTFVHLTVLYGYVSSVKSNASVGDTVRPVVGRIKWFVHFYITFPLITNMPPPRPFPPEGLQISVLLWLMTTLINADGVCPSTSVWRSTQQWASCSGQSSHSHACPRACKDHTHAKHNTWIPSCTQKLCTIGFFFRSEGHHCQDVNNSYQPVLMFLFGAADSTVAVKERGLLH